MKQVVQNLRSGKIGVEEVPAPSARSGLGAPGVLVATACSVISPGTERAAVELGRASLLGKALRRPDQVRKVLENLRREGFAATLKKVQQRLDVTRAMGYSCAGRVIEARECEIAPGTRVACVGTDAATHGEINFVPRNFVAAIPEGVSLEEAAFVALGGIALHATHLSGAAVGEQVAVLGLGPVGLLLAQVLRAEGCCVAGFDLREDRMHVARQLGFERVARAERGLLGETLHAWGISSGFARVFVAAASKTSRPVDWAVEAAADRATLVIVGDVRTNLPRNACYAKELRVVYARSYGPGRYDPAYEESGEDFPVEQERWSLRRNLEAFLEMLARKQVGVAPLITHRYAVDDAVRAYEIVSDGSAGSVGVVLQYAGAANSATTVNASSAEVGRHGGPPIHSVDAKSIRVGFIGAGNYARAYLLPELKAPQTGRSSRRSMRDAQDATDTPLPMPRTGQSEGAPALEPEQVVLITVANARGISAKRAAEEFGFARCTTDAYEALCDAEVNTVFIAARHNLHGPLAAEALAAGKAVFVEKPLGLSEAELWRIVEAHEKTGAMMMVGHNRRFAPVTRALREFFAGAGPMEIRYTVHAGPLPAGHWLRNPAQGGRVLGEACHFVDWCCAMAGGAPSKIDAEKLGEFPNDGVDARLNFADGSVATIHYDCAPVAGAKEVIEISAGDKTARVEDFARATLVEAGKKHTESYRGKGQAEMVAAFLAGVASGKMPVSFEEWVESARAILEVASGECRVARKSVGTADERG